MKKLLIFLLLAVYGCSTTAYIAVINDKNSNPNIHGDNVPVTLKLYKLNGVERFQEASVLDLNTREDAVLGKDKIDVVRMQIAPNDTKVMAEIKKKEIGYIGILVLFATMQNKKYKSAVRSKDISGDNVTFTITNQGVFITGKKKGNIKKELINGK
ncbi:MAG: type VI secretion system lipoprotein TssJ [Mucispirillum sp.]|nr:type VI secretion system lipoprotein TssJ [Mucispirillum sp.]